MRSQRQFFALCLVAVVLFSTGLAASGQEPPGGTLSKDGADSTAGVDGLSGPEFQISLSTTPAADRYAPSVAYNWRHNEYLVVWHNVWPDGHRDIYARRVSASGQPLTWFSISAGPNDRAQPAVVYNGTNDEYLVVWMYNVSGNGTTYEIWGRTVAWNGGYLNPEFQIITWPNRTFWTPRAAWNSLRNQYLVVWAAFDTTTWLPTDVAHALLAADGTKLFGTIVGPADDPHQPDVTYNVATDEFFVVWRTMAAAADGDIRGARISGATGTIISPPGHLVVSDAPSDQAWPTVTTNGQDRYLVAWEHVFDPNVCCDWDIRAQLLDVNGAPVGIAFSVAYTLDDETRPAAVARPGPKHEYLVTWQRATAAGAAIQGLWWNDSDSALLDIADYAFWNSEMPAVAAARTSFLTVYEADSQGDPGVMRHIYGRRFVPYARFLPVVLRRW